MWQNGTGSPAILHKPGKPSILFVISSSRPNRHPYRIRCGNASCQSGFSSGLRCGTCALQLEHMLLELDRRNTPVVTLPFEAGARIVFFRSAAACSLALPGIITGALPKQWGINIVVLLAGEWNVSLGRCDARKEYPNAECYKANAGNNTHFG